MDATNPASSIAQFEIAEACLPGAGLGGYALADDIRFVFSNGNARISKRSRTTYGAWADAHGFPWAHRTVPKGWLTEKGTATAKRAMREIIDA